MHFVITDLDGGTVEAFDDLEAAEAALLHLAALDPARRGDFFLLGYSASGEPVGEARSIDDILAWRAAKAPQWSGANPTSNVRGPTPLLRMSMSISLSLPQSIRVTSDQPAVHAA